MGAKQTEVLVVYLQLYELFIYISSKDEKCALIMYVYVAIYMYIIYDKFYQIL